MSQYEILFHPHCVVSCVRDVKMILITQAASQRNKGRHDSNMFTSVEFYSLDWLHPAIHRHQLIERTS